MAGGSNPSGPTNLHPPVPITVQLVDTPPIRSSGELKLSFEAVFPSDAGSIIRAGDVDVKAISRQLRVEANVTVKGSTGAAWGGSTGSA